MSVDLVFWSAAVRNYGFKQHVEAAKAGNFTSMAIAPEVYQTALEEGISPSEMRKMAEDAGAPLRYLDSLADWAPRRVPTECSPDLRARFDVPTDYCFRMCDKLGLTSILAVPGFDAGDCELPQLVDGFGKLCDRARVEGYWVDLEFMPFRGMANLSDAWHILNGVRPANAGILVDVWHFSKGAYDMELLRAIPGEYLVGMQVDDGVFHQVGTSLFDDTSNYRNFPGEGEMDVVEIIDVIAKKGHLRHVGPEVFSLEADALSPQAVGRRCGETTRKVLSDAGVSIREPQI